MKNFYNILLNTLIASVTNSFLWFALTFWMYLETRSVIATSIIGGSFMVFASLSSLFFGHFVDHHKKKYVMLFSSIVTLAMYALATALFFGSQLGSFLSLTNPITWIFVILILMGTVVGNMRSIALSTVVTILVDPDKRDKANGLVGTVNGISFAITSVFSGLVIGLLGMNYALLISVVLTFITTIHLFTIEIPEKKIAHTTHEEKKLDLAGTIRAISSIPGLFGLIIFTTFNNLLGGVFMALMDAYGLSLVSVEFWGILWGVLSMGFIIGGITIANKGLGTRPLRTLLLVNVVMWTICIFFTIYSSIILTAIGLFLYMCLIPVVEAVEQTIVQKLVPLKRQGRVFGFAHSVESAASPITAFLIGPIAQLFFMPFMATGGRGAQLIGSWFGTGPERGIALVFVSAGVIGLIVTLIALSSKTYKTLSSSYANSKS